MTFLFPCRKMLRAVKLLCILQVEQNEQENSTYKCVIQYLVYPKIDIFLLNVPTFI